MAKKLPPHVTKLDNGKYRVRYKKTSKYPYEFDKTFDTIEEAINVNEEYLAKNKLNLLTESSSKGNMSFTKFCDYYLDWLRNKSKRPSHNTIKGYISKMNQLKILLGNKKLNEITTYDIELLLSKEKNRPRYSNGSKGNLKISNHTIHHEYTMLRILFNKAFKWGFIDKNPIMGVEEPTFEEKKIIVPEYEELDEIESKIFTAPIRERCQFLLAFYTGMREEEVCGVHLEDFNFEEKYILVSRAIVQNELTKEYIEDRTKSQSSVRKLPLPNKFFEVLKEYLIYRRSIIDYLKLKTNGNYQELPNIFLNKDGHFYRPHRLYEKWSKFAKENNINLTFHGLRHYYLTNQMNYNDDLSPRDVQELAGHSNINTTFKYVHPSKKRIQNNATNLFSKFSKDDLYKNGNNCLTIPIAHIASIILGNSNLAKTNDLQITLKELSDKEIDFFNISEIIENCKNYLITNYPSLNRIEKYKYANFSDKEIIENISKEFGKEFIIEKNIQKDFDISI